MKRKTPGKQTRPRPAPATSRRRFFGHGIPGVELHKLVGKLIVVEGADGSGRSTQIAKLVDWLEGRGHATKQVGLSRSTLVSEELDQAKTGNILSRTTLSLFYATDFADQLENSILPALRSGFMVLADRYIYTLMVRDLVRGMDDAWLKNLYGIALVPDAVFYLQVSPEELVQRNFSKAHALDYWESGMDLGFSRDLFDSFLQYQSRVGEQFLRLQSTYGFEVIDAHRSVDEINLELRKKISALLEAETGEPARAVSIPFSKSPPPQRRAVIDVGTNSVKLLVADVAGANVIPIEEQSKQTRLGRGFYEANLLQAEAISATAEAARKFARQARALGAENIRIIATSAARDARNAVDLLGAIQSATGLSVEIISGEKEADWVFQGVMSDARLSGNPWLILDVGGGSTEFILGQDDVQSFRRSHPLGTVRLLEKLALDDPPGATALANCRAELKVFLDQHVAPELEGALKKWKRPVPLIGTGGTTTILARMEKRLEKFERGPIEAARLTRAQVSAHVKRLWSLPLDERKKIIGLPPKRADVILTGAVIYEAVMARFGFDELRVSTRGLRYAAVMNRSAA